MSQDYEVELPAHYNIYDNSQRSFNVYFSEPGAGINEETGLLLLIPGFGGNANSNVYKKMRSQFADQYNLVTIQCDYFGQAFMQGSQSFNISISKEQVKGILQEEEQQRIFENVRFNAEAFLNIGRNYPLQVHVKENLKESISNFNDMGLMQAMDCLASVCYVIAIIKENNLTFNQDKIIAYGHSHGAYLAHLCNLLSPKLFSHLIDNSAWLYPGYLTTSRLLYQSVGKMTLTIEFDYLARQVNEVDAEILSLTKMYKGFKNECEIYVYQGTADTLIHFEEKRKFCSLINHCTYFEVGRNEVDGEAIRSNGHGLDADHLKMFHRTIHNMEFEKRSSTSLFLEKEIVSSKCRYLIQYQNGIPLLRRFEK